MPNPCSTLLRTNFSLQRCTDNPASQAVNALFHTRARASCVVRCLAHLLTRVYLPHPNCHHHQHTHTHRKKSAIKRWQSKSNPSNVSNDEKYADAKEKHLQEERGGKKKQKRLWERISEGSCCGGIFNTDGGADTDDHRHHAVHRKALILALASELVMIVQCSTLSTTLLVLSPRLHYNQINPFDYFTKKKTEFPAYFNESDPYVFGGESCFRVAAIKRCLFMGGAL